MFAAFLAVLLEMGVPLVEPAPLVEPPPIVTTIRLIAIDNISLSYLTVPLYLDFITKKISTDRVDSPTGECCNTYDHCTERRELC